jgi:hypothetical protein
LFLTKNFFRLRIWGSGVRISSGAPKIHGSLPDASLPGGHLIAQ